MQLSKEELAAIMNELVVIGYTNYKGIKGERLIKPIELWFGSTEWHPEPQWLLKAYDLDKHAERDFAMVDICYWSRVVSPKPTTDSQES